MKKFFAVLLLLTATIFTGCGDEKESSTEKKSDNVLFVGIDDEFAPMTFRDENGELVGFDIDFAKETAKRLGVTFKFRPIDWNAKEVAITSGNVDMIWSACDITDEYKAYMIFGKPYMDNRQIVLTRKDDASEIQSESDFAGKIVGTQSDSNSESYINENKDLKKTFAEFKTYRSANDGFAALNGGEIDLLVVDEIAGRYELSKSPDTFRAIEVTVGPATEFGIGFRKDNAELRDKIQKVFDEIVADGTAKKISEKWFHADLIKQIQ